LLNPLIGFARSRVRVAATARLDSEISGRSMTVYWLAQYGLVSPGLQGIAVVANPLWVFCWMDDQRTSPPSIVKLEPVM
jgi:hypothetical protein